MGWRPVEIPLATDNLLEVTGELLRTLLEQSASDLSMAVACCPLVLLTCAHLMTSSHSGEGHRAAAFATGGLIPQSMRGRVLAGYIHVADWCVLHTRPNPCSSCCGARVGNATAALYLWVMAPAAL